MTCIVFHLRNYAFVQLFLYVWILGQLKADISQSSGGRVESGQHEECWLIIVKRHAKNKTHQSIPSMKPKYVRYNTWAIMISSISSRDHIGTVSPSTSLVKSDMASSANSIKSWNFFINKTTTNDNLFHMLYTSRLYVMMKSDNTFLDCRLSLSTSSNSLKKNLNSFVINKRSANLLTELKNFGNKTVERDSSHFKTIQSIIVVYVLTR